MSNRKRSWTHLAALLVAGCAAGPDYVAPAVDTGGGWVEPQVADAAPPPLSEWWTVFEDPTLEDLVARARENNTDLRQGVQRVAQARALRAVAAGGRYPTVDAAAGITRRRQSENGPLPIGRIPGLERDQTIFETGFDAAWEVDLFGRNRRAVEAADARLGETVAQHDGARLTVTAEVVRTWLTLRGLRREREVLASALRLSAQTAAITRRQFELGEVAEARLAQAEAETASLQAELPLLDADIRSQALALGVLLGEPPEAGLTLPRPTSEQPPLTRLPVGERADLLRRRPDVRAAEWRLVAATAESGLAAAELFPRLSIGAGGSFQSLDASDLFDLGSQAWHLVPRVSWRIFDAGRVRAQLHASEAGAEAAALAYEAAVLAALLDAERALSRYHHDLLALEQQRTAVAAARRNHELAQRRYDAGDISLLELVDAERGLRRAETAHVRMHRLAATDLVALFKALGGGWE